MIRLEGNLAWGTLANSMADEVDQGGGGGGGGWRGGGVGVGSNGIHMA